MEIGENRYITENPNFKEIQELQNINTNYQHYFDIWQKCMEKLFSFLDLELPNCKIILAKNRLSDRLSDGSSLTAMRKEKGLPFLDFNKMNTLWKKLDDYIISHHDVLILDIFKKSYFLDKNHLRGPDYLHYEPKFYNTFLNKLIKLVLNHKRKTLNPVKNVKTIQRIYLDEDYELLNTKAIEVVLHSKKI